MSGQPRAGAPFLIDERVDADGAHHRTTLRPEGGALLLEEDGAALGRLPVVAVRTVMLRYARALDPEALADAAFDEAALPLGEDRLRRMRYRAAVDAIGRDYLVWETSGQAPAAVLSVTVTAALRHLAQATRRQ